MRAWRRYLLPALVFQSVVIGGAYGTGVELVQFFGSQGPVGGLLGIAVSMAVFSAVAMVTYELARMWGAFDYRHFFQGLLGRWWWLFEACFVVIMLLVLGVVAAAAGEILQATFGLAYWLGVALAMIGVAGLVFGGNASIERFFSMWSFVLYGLYAVFFVWCFRVLGGDIAATLGSEPAGTGWVWAGLRYAGYNLVVIAPVLATLRVHETRTETFVAGALSGPVAMLPGLLFHLASLGRYPGILEATVPTNELLEVLGSRGFQVAFQVVLFGTLLETGAGLIHAFNERISGLLSDGERELPRWVRPAVGLGLLGLASALSAFGLGELIASGYGTATIGVLVVYVLPVLTLGVWKLRRRASSDPPPRPS